jgi:rubrerythrin
MEKTSDFAYWHRHFLAAPDTLPWDHPCKLSEPERGIIASSVQQFQLGEFARGRGFLRRAAAHPVLGTDPWFVPALERFIAQEQEHSAMLGRFLDREGIPRLRAHWVDQVFRRLRKLAGLELCAMVLVTAEVLAMPFYRALGEATRSSLLRAICGKVLEDEAAHLRYQAVTLGVIRGRLGSAARAARTWFHKVLFSGAALILWEQHRRVFRAAGVGFRRFWQDAGREFEALQDRIRQVSLQRGPLR